MRIIESWKGRISVGHNFLFLYTSYRADCMWCHAMPCLTSSFVVKCLAFFWTMVLWPSFFFSQNFEVLLILSKPSMHDDYHFFISLSLHIPHLFKAYLPTSQESSSSAIIFCAPIHLAVTLTFFYRTQSCRLMDYLIRTPNHLYYLHSLYLGSRASVLCFISQRWKDLLLLFSGTIWRAASMQRNGCTLGLAWKVGFSIK